jgi:glycosyltransferase involved in cell wall biosynthesis
MSKQRTILFLHSSSELYGASKIFLQVLEVTSNLGYVPLVILPGPGPLFEALQKRDIEVKLINLAILRRKYFNFFGLLDRGRKFVAAYHQISKICQEREIQLIYSNTLAVIVGAVFSIRAKIPHVWHIHEIIKSPKVIRTFLSKIIDLSSTKPIVVSSAVEKHWSKYLKKARPVVIYNGIDYTPFISNGIASKEKFNLPSKKTIITMVGRINPGKGQLFFLEMAKRLIEKHGNAIHFLMVGDAYPGYERIETQIDKYIQEQIPSGQITKLGFRQEIPELLKLSDIFVLPSTLPDSFPTVILEAMASELPIVATRSGGASEMVEEGVTGFLIPLGNVELGTEKISFLIQNKEAAKAMGKFAKSQVLKQYSLESFDHKIKNHLCQFLP